MNSQRPPTFGGRCCVSVARGWARRIPPRTSSIEQQRSFEVHASRTAPVTKSRKSCVPGLCLHQPRAGWPGLGRGSATSMPPYDNARTLRPGRFFVEWRRRDSNSRPLPCHGSALPTELRPRQRAEPDRRLGSASASPSVRGMVRTGRDGSRLGGEMGGGSRTLGPVGIRDRESVGGQTSTIWVPIWSV